MSLTGCSVHAYVLYIGPSVYVKPLYGAVRYNLRTPANNGGVILAIIDLWLKEDNKWQL